LHSSAALAGTTVRQEAAETEASGSELASTDLPKPVDVRDSALPKLAAAAATQPLMPFDEATLSEEVRNELILLKERNRLSSYADSAIGGGDRQALEDLIAVFTSTDASTQRLRGAALSEFLRAKYFHMSADLNAGFQLPVRELFKDAGILDERDLGTGQLLALVADQGKDWRVRSRAALLLRGSKSPEVLRGLAQSIRTDPRLEVVRDSYISLLVALPEGGGGSPGDLFSFIDFEAWWKQFSKTLPKPQNR